MAKKMIQIENEIEFAGRNQDSGKNLSPYQEFRKSPADWVASLVVLTISGALFGSVILYIFLVILKHMLA